VLTVLYWVLVDFTAAMALLRLAMLLERAVLAPMAALAEEAETWAFIVTA